MGKNMGKAAKDKSPNRLTVRAVDSFTERGYYHDGRGLYLVVSKAGTKSWIYRYRAGKAKEVGLGGYPLIKLPEARRKANALRLARAEGNDPQAVRTVAHTDMETWGGYATAAIAKMAKGYKDPDKQGMQNLNMLKTHGPAFTLPLKAVTDKLVLSTLTPLWPRETGTRLRSLIERVWEAARSEGLVTGNNPARWQGWLQHHLTKPSKVKKPKPHKAMPYKDVPSFFAKLYDSDSRRAESLQFCILTATRTTEVREAEWSEFDLAEKVWTIPAARMKATKEFRVPLSNEAISVLETVKKKYTGDGPFMLSENAMLDLLKKKGKGRFNLPYTVHGFRSSFRDYISEELDIHGDVAEMCLSHQIKDRAEASYRRGDLLKQRKEIMQKWADYCMSTISP